MYTKPGWRRRLRYAFDNTLSHGPAALIAWLALATLALIVLAVVIDLLSGGTADDLGPLEVIWSVIFQALTPNPPGNLDSPWQFLVVMLGVTLFSLAMVSILIGLLSATIQNRIETLRRGRSQIVEHGHTVILGWSEQVFPLIAELVTANANQRHAAIAILGDHDKVEMEEALRQRVPHTGRTRVVYRRGSPTELADLDLVLPQASKSIIILPDDEQEAPDSSTIKTILALINARHRRPQPYHIVTMLREEKNIEIARLVGGAEVELVLSGDIIARIIAQTCRQVGLSLVYTELLDFAGDEIYFQAEPTLVGKTFGEALLAYEDSAVMGVFTKDGQVRLNPPMDTVIGDGDQVIAVSEDDDTVRVRPQGASGVPLQPDAIETSAPAVALAERILILGWNWRAATIIRQLDAYVAPGSGVTVVAEHDAVEEELRTLSGAVNNLEVRYLAADTTSRAVLDDLHVAAFNHVIILCYSDTLDHQRADGLTLLTLLHLRRIAEQEGHKFSITSEMMDVRNRNLAESTRADDFIVSERLISLMLAQIAENKALNQVFDDLLDPRGSEIFLRPVTDYIKPGVPVSFYTVVEAAKRRGQVALGYRLHAHSADRERGYGVVVNPDKSVPVTFQPGDVVIVLSES